MREIKLSEIRKKCNSPDVIVKDKLIRNSVRSEPNYNPGRKRPKDPDEQRILARFKLK